MEFNEIMTLARAGYNAQQIAAIGSMQARPAQPVQAPVQQIKPAQPVQAPFQFYQPMQAPVQPPVQGYIPAQTYAAPQYQPAQVPVQQYQPDPMIANLVTRMDGIQAAVQANNALTYTQPPTQPRDPLADMAGLGDIVNPPAAEQ